MMAITGLVRTSSGMAALLMAAALAGCGDPTREGPAPVDMSGVGGPKPVYAALGGSVGEVSMLGSSQDVRVEGYGLVVELPNTGSSDMQPNIREIITDQLYANEAGKPGSGLPSPDEILSSPRVAAVEVRGVIPAMAPGGTVFDLTVSALPGSQTSSLKYGLLWPADLSVIGLTDKMAQTRKMADGRGPTYFEMVDEPAPATAPATMPNAVSRNMRKARVIGGGMTTDDMMVQLQLYSPSLHYVQSMQRVINFKFQEKPAIGANPSVLRLVIPQRYRAEPRRFIELCQNLFLAQDSPGFVRQKAPELIQGLKDKTPGTPYRQLSVALEGLGTEALVDFLRPNYLSSDPVVRYYTARAGAALNDVQAIVVLQELATDPASSFRIDAVNELGADARTTNNVRAMMALSDLLDAENIEVRKAAYRGLATLDTPAIQHIPDRRFDMDLVQSKGPPLIYVTQTGMPKIALIGRDIKVNTGAFYVSTDNILTVDCKDKESFADWSMQRDLKLNGEKIAPERNVVLYYRGVLGNQSITLTSNPSLAAIIRRLMYSPDPRSPNYSSKEVFAGVGYQRVVEMLLAMSKSGMIDAQVYVEPAPGLIGTVSDVAEQARPEGLIYSKKPKPAAAPLKSEPVAAKGGE